MNARGRVPHQCVARGRGTDGDGGRAGVRRVERQLYRGGTTVVRGTATVGVAAGRALMVLELGDSPPAFCAQRFGGHGVWGLAQGVREGTLAPQGQESSGLGAVVLRDAVRWEDSGITNGVHPRTPEIILPGREAPQRRASAEDRVVARRRGTDGETRHYRRSAGATSS